MFTEQEIKHIKMVKSTIQEYINIIRTTEWWNGNFANDMYLTGGAIASIIQDERPKDWDFYCKDIKTNDSLKHWLQTIGHDNIADVDEKYKEFQGQNGKMITANAITMDNDASFITMLVGKPKDVRKTFDYIHCLPYYDLSTDTLYISKLQYDCCKNKLLVVSNEKSVKIYRESKFLERGYKPTNIDKMLNSA
jgi:hypothetical protein